MSHFRAFTIIAATATLLSAQPKSALEFYDTTGTNAKARFGWTDANGGEFFLQAPVGTNVLTTQEDDVTVSGNVTANEFHGDGSSLSGVSKPGHNHSSADIVDGTLMDRDISPSAAIAGTKVVPDFGSANVRTSGSMYVGGYTFWSGTRNIGPGDRMFFGLSANNDTLFELGPGFWGMGDMHDNTLSVPGPILCRGIQNTGHFYTGAVLADTIDAQVYLTNGSPGSPSDRRLKTDIQPLDNAVERVSRLDGVRYHYRTGEHAELGLPEGDQVGLIAQDVEQVLPEAVHTNREGYKHIEYDKLVPVLVNAIKEQQTVIDQQSRDIEKLKSRIGIE
jgi:hypothetical protein